MITWNNKFDDKALHAKSPSTECESLTIDNDYKDPWVPQRNLVDSQCSGIRLKTPLTRQGDPGKRLAQNS